MSRQKFQRLMSYLHAHIEEGINLDTLCKEAGMSRYHFHRQFSAYLGMPVQAYVGQLGLLKALHRLAYHPQSTVTEIAYDAGYQAPEAFSRAFKSHFGVTPSEFRRAPDWAVIKAKQDLLQQGGVSMQQQTDYEVRLEQRQTVPIAVMEHKGPEQMLGKTIQAFIQWRKAHQLPPSRYRTFNLLFEDPQLVAPHDYRFGLATEVTATNVWPPSDVYMSEIPEGLYACVTHIGADHQLEHTVRWLYEHWLPASGYAPADYPLLAERKTFYPDVPAHRAETDVLLPLQA